MTVRYNIMSYLIGEGVRNVLKNKKSTGAALTIMCMAMFMFGIFFILGENVNYVMAQVETEQGMQVFMDFDVTEEQVREAEIKIRAIDEMRETLGDGELLEGIEDYFQESFIVTLTDLELNTSVQEQIKALDNIDEITGSNNTIEMLYKIAKGVRLVTFMILVILVIIAIFIITNTIKLTVHARRKEISIMKYVGATNSFIRWPFIVEGIIIGVISALITILVVGFMYNLATNGIVETQTFQKLSLKLYTFADMFKMLIVTYLLLGAGIGIIGSSISMRKYLEV